MDLAALEFPAIVERLRAATESAYGGTLAETLLPGVPVSRAALAAYEKAKANAPDDDEGKMIEIVSQPK